MPDLAPERRANLVIEAIKYQTKSAKAHWFTVYRGNHRWSLHWASKCQNETARFSRRARECLFALIGSDHEERLAFVGAGLILAELYVASWVLV